LKVDAGPGPLKYWPSISIWLTSQPLAAPTTKSSASSVSKAFCEASKFCELDANGPGLLYWS
jgi:hypothetical protein